MNGSVWKDEQLVRKFLDGVRGSIPFAKEQIEVMLRLIDASLKKESVHFIDLGCGDGILSAAILKHYPKAKGILIDFSEPMLTQAKIKLKKYSNQIEFISADLGKSEWLSHVKRDNSFNLIVSGFCIHHQTDSRKKELYKEIFRILKPKVMFINIEHVASSSIWIESRSDDMLIDSLWTFHCAGGGRKTRKEIVHEFVHRPDKKANILARVDDQCSWLRKIGFEDVDCYFKSFELAVFGGRKPRTKVYQKNRRILI